MRASTKSLPRQRLPANRSWIGLNESVAVQQTQRQILRHPEHKRGTSTRHD
jgi:hypothetical protein